MTKNKLNDLNDHLFAQLERLADEDMTPEQIEAEVKRTSAIVEVSDQITQNSRTRLQAAKLFAEHGDKMLPMLPAIGGPSNSGDQQ
jgi:hypothetical protein